MNSVEQQYVHCRYKVPIETFHLRVHTFTFHWTVQDLEIFFIQSNSPLAVKGLDVNLVRCERSKFWGEETGKVC